MRPLKPVCKVCQHVEHAFLSALLEQGFAPRAISKRVGGVTRRGLARHRDRCLQRDEKKEGKGG